MGTKQGALVIAAALVVLGAAMPAWAGDLTDTTGKARIEGSFDLGIGASNIVVAATTTGDAVTISGGGGVGGGITFGYGLSQAFDADVTLGGQESVLIPAVAGATGTFKRTLALFTLKYKIPVKDDGRIKVGLGVGSYRSGEMDVNTSTVAGGSHTVIQYDNAVGEHVTGEYEAFINQSLSLVVGLKIYTVTYRAKSATYDGVPEPTSSLSGKARNLDGTGVDFTAGLAYYF